MPDVDKVSAVAASKAFSIACLQLCEASYQPPADIPGCVAQVNPLTPSGKWVCSWSAQDDDEANLALVALHYAATGTVPDWAVLTIRGTDIDVPDIWGVLWQIWEDLDFTLQVPLPWAPPTPPGNQALIAQGTLDGIDEILGLSFNGSSLLTYLGTLTNDAGLSFAVTGHSLGGCLATVMASGLRAKLLPNVLPVTFAAPTAGNEAFADHFQGQFPNALCYASSLDVAPKAWGNLTSLDTIYQPCGLSIPDTVYVGAAVIDDAMYWSGVGYVQPVATPLTASCSGTTDWYSEAFYQHHPSSYMKWLGGTDICIAPALVMASSGKPTVARLHAKLGPLSEVIRKNRSGASLNPTT